MREIAVSWSRFVMIALALAVFAVLDRPGGMAQLLFQPGSAHDLGR